ncbi:MAG: nucleoside-diphosphate kinase [Candidatus Diapherotrites archaeon]|jgi:nucleoside-diphosphate kinase|uniref:Nucleoside diphosphate kinase n=1 Tax=Candidatus Iainarchaeum sp. TaxID=3101447 RepID=A0A7K4BZB4_9ARCH|nr:nucleoside-diphosphate kinase [Candidatus Diapherotrites archaeon]
MIEKTLLIVKPDGVQRGLTGEILKRFELVGLKIVGMKMMRVDDTLAAAHYDDVKERRGEKIFAEVIDLITMGPVVAVVLEGVDAVATVRKICGSTEPHIAMPGTIRGDFAHVSFAYSDKVDQAVRNVVHASGTRDEAKREIDLWFKPEEIQDYPSVHEIHTLHQKAKDIKKMRGYKPENQEEN